VSWRTRTLVLVLLLLTGVPLAGGGSTGPAPADAQTGPPDSFGDPAHGEQARVSVLAIDLAVGPGALRPDASDPTELEAANVSEALGWALLVENASAATWSRVEVVAEVHAALGSRSALRAALAGGTVPAAVRRTAVRSDVDELAPGGVVRLEGQIALVGRELSSPTSAVHPLRLRVLADGAVVASIDTAIVRLGSAPTAPLSATLVWPLTAPPLRDPQGGVAAELDASTVPGGRLDTMVSALAAARPEADARTTQRRRGDGLALAPALHLIEDLELRATGVPPELVDEVAAGTPLARAITAWPDVEEGAARAAVLLRRIRTATMALPEGPVTTPYADADLARLLASTPALQPLAARAVLEGSRRVLPLLDRPQAPVMLLDAPVSPDSLDLLLSGTVLLPYEAIEAPDLALDVPIGEPVRTLSSPTGRTLIAVIADPHLTAALSTSTRGGPGDPVLAAHEVLVRTAMIHLEAPGRQGRSVLLLPPQDFDPDPRFAATLLAGLDAAPWLVPRGPGALVAAAPEALEPATLAPWESVMLPARLTDALLRTERDLELLVGAAAGGPSSESFSIGARDLSMANDELMRAASRATSSDVERALALLAGVRAGVDTAFGAFEVAAADVTLTDRDGIVPVTVLHRGGIPLRVRVEVDGPSALTWPEGRVRELVLASDGSGSLEIPVRSGPTGRFPVTVRVTDPSGVRELVTSTLSVRATTIAAPALGFISAVIAILVIVGAARQSRRGPTVSPGRSDRAIGDRRDRSRSGTDVAGTDRTSR